LQRQVLAGCFQRVVVGGAVVVGDQRRMQTGAELPGEGKVGIAGGDAAIQQAVVEQPLTQLRASRQVVRVQLVVLGVGEGDE
jgi:hypothetical protein